MGYYFMQTLFYGNTFHIDYDSRIWHCQVNFSWRYPGVGTKNASKIVLEEFWAVFHVDGVPAIGPYTLFWSNGFIVKQINLSC